MAQGKNEHRMLFDIRGRRKNVVRVVYAVLAVLMGLSLFLVVGGFNLAELFNSSNSTGDAAKPYEEQAERIEAKLVKAPEDPNLLLSLTRAQVNSGNAQVEVEANGQQQITLDAIQEYQRANQSWSEYLKATKEPNVSLAILMSNTLLQLAEYSRSFAEASSNIQAAVDAQKIVAEQRPSVGAYTTLSLYTYFTGDFAAADKAKEEALKLAGGKPEEESVEKQLAETKKNAEQFLQQKKQGEKEAKAQAEGKGGAGAGNAEVPGAGESPLGSAFGGGALGE